MFRRGLVVSLLALGLLGAGPARAADPLLMFIFGMAREIMYEAFQASQQPSAPNAEPLPEVYPGTMVEPRKLREMIDESFFYLSERRREELFQAFHEEIIKPKNAAVRASMIAYFTERALAVRMVMERLSKLNEQEMRALSEHFAAQARALPPAELEQLRKVVNEGLLPVPPDLNQRLVVAIRDIPQAPAAEDAPQTAAAENAKAAAEQTADKRSPEAHVVASTPPEERMPNPAGVSPPRPAAPAVR